MLSELAGIGRLRAREVGGALKMPVAMHGGLKGAGGKLEDLGAARNEVEDGGGSSVRKPGGPGRQGGRQL